MAQAATPGGLGLPCSPKQALALYQRLFRCPAGLGQLQAALRQVQEGHACSSGLELPAMLLEMERSRRAHEQLLWDLELLTGAGLGLFWPPRAQFHGPRGQTPCVWRQHSKPRGEMGADCKQLRSGISRSCSLPQAEGTLSQNHRFLERGHAADPPSAPDLGEAGSCTGPRREGPGVPAEPTPGHLQKLDHSTSSSSGEPGHSEFKNLDRKEDRGQAEPVTQRPLPPSPGSLRGRKMAQEGTRLSGLPQVLRPLEGLGWSLSQDRAELQKLLGIKIPVSQREEMPQEEKEETLQGPGGAPQGENEDGPQRQKEETDQGQSREATEALGQELSGGLGQETPPSENEDAFQDQKGNLPECPRKETPQRGEVKTLPSSGGRGQTSGAWEAPQGEAPTQPQEEGGFPGIPGGFCKSLGEKIAQPGQQASPGPKGMGNQQTQDRTHSQGQETALGEQRDGLKGALAPPWPRRPAAPPQLPGPEALMLTAPSTTDSEQQECPTAFLGPPGLVHSRQELQGPGGNLGLVQQEAGEATGPRADGSMRFPGPLEERRGVVKGPKALKAAWPGPPGREKASAGMSAAQQKTALQRLLELQGAARRRRWQDREQQRLRVLDRLRIAGNCLRRVHPLGPPPSPAQLLPQKDEAGQRQALREQLEQVHRERTRQLRALGARNTQNFQQLLCPSGAKKPAPGK